MSLLKDATNYFGPLSADVRARILIFMNAPSKATWDDIASIIINARSMRRGTVWQAVTALDPTFPTSVKSGVNIGPERWPRYPDPMTVARAIKEATR